MNATYDQYIGRVFRTLVVQPTSLCNLDCAYCYLPDRKQRREMAPDVARALRDSIARQGTRATPVEIVWHGGEPLAMPLPRMETLIAHFGELRNAGFVRHSVQTNATLIDAAWCRFFRAYDFTVGVSIDGPEFANHNRLDRRGRSTYERAMRGIERLRDAGIAFSAICVVSPETIEHPDELLTFFAELRCVKVGFNIEEYEGANLGRALVSSDAAQRFWQSVITFHRDHPELRIRELEGLAGYLTKARNTRKKEWTQAKHDPIPTIGWNGDVVLLSPELLGATSPRHGDFVVGNVLDMSLTEILNRAHTMNYVGEFVDGIDACERECAFYDFCRGAHAGNRFFEHGTFAATETAHCRNTKQALVRALATTIKETG